MNICIPKNHIKLEYNSKWRTSGCRRFQRMDVGLEMTDMLTCPGEFLSLNLRKPLGALASHFTTPSSRKDFIFTQSNFLVQLCRVPD